MKQVIVVGAGASGMMAAIAAARAGADVRLLEGMKKPGRKLLLTGNGKCNITHLDEDMASSYAQGSAFVREVFSRFGPGETLDFFRELGLLCREKDGYVYPACAQAQSVLAVLQRELHVLGVRQKYDARVTRIVRDKSSLRWVVSLADWDYQADSVILCCGSKACAQTGSDGSGYQLAMSLGHHAAPVQPALCAMSCADKDLKLTAGARTRARAFLFGDEALAFCQRLSKNNTAACVLPEHMQETLTCLGSEAGEIQWKEREISGIAVFNLSRQLRGGRNRGLLVVDFLPEYSREQTETLLQKQLDKYAGRGTLQELLGGLVNDKVAAFLVRKSGWKDKEWKAANLSAIAADFTLLLKCMAFEVNRKADFSQAQICTGGIPTEEIFAHSMESRLEKGLYFAGEMVDIDGPCGGYNLQWAWSSGYMAGCKAAG